MLFGGGPFASAKIAGIRCISHAHGDEFLRIADISRLSRNEAGTLLGYQRAEVKRHIRNIVEYLDSSDVLFPNSLILALPSSTRFDDPRIEG